MAGNDRTRNRRHKPELKAELKAEKKPDRKPVNRPECLTAKGPELYLPQVSPDAFPGENMVERSLSISLYKPYTPPQLDKKERQPRFQSIYSRSSLDFFVLLHLSSAFFSHPELIIIILQYYPSTKTPKCPLSNMPGWTLNYCKTFFLGINHKHHQQSQYSTKPPYNMTETLSHHQS